MILSCIKTLETTRLSFYSIVHENNTKSEIVKHIEDMGHSDVILTDYDDLMAHVFASNPPNVRDHRAVEDKP